MSKNTSGASGQDIIVVGAGLAGLFTALKLAPHSVTVITSAGLGTGGSSPWAQGGIAAALGADDAPTHHADDTQIAGGGIADRDMAKILTQEIAARIEDLAAFGIAFDRGEAQQFLLSQEAGHRTRRIVRSAGDMAGQKIMLGLTKAARQAEHITIIENCAVGRLAHQDGEVHGVFAQKEGARDWEYMPASAVVLATGGCGHLYKTTTNPPQAIGAGLAMAAQAGAQIADAEFVQFHPTALAIDIDPAPLATEALRGEGALLIDSHGQRFMKCISPAAELASRDLVARAVAQAVHQGGAFLDARVITSVDIAVHFPVICETCRRVGLDPKKDLIPIAPAAHYHMGGIAADQYGKSSLQNLWVCGESAANGTHGANRLAGNSLGEALVFAARAAQNIEAGALEHKQKTYKNFQDQKNHDPQIEAELRQIMTEYVGVMRDEVNLKKALALITALEAKAQTHTQMENMLITARFIAAAALLRRESRGAHHRKDHPSPDPAQAHRIFLTLAQARDIE